MNIDELIRRKTEVVERYGPWTAHNIQLGGDVYTINKRVVGDEIKLRRIIQIIADIAGKPLSNLRVLDLACLEGLYAIELAHHGAKVLAVEGREANIEKARFAKRVLSLESLELVQDDVRNISKEKYGRFDAVLCLGILYHLDAPDVFCFAHRVAEVCKRIAIIDTHVSVTAEKSSPHNGDMYWGRDVIDHSADTTADERAKALWSSLDNLQSFWFTRPSLYNLLSHVGFTSLYECHNPPELQKPYDRITLLAIKGQRQTLASAPVANGLSEDRWPEEQRLSVHPGPRKYLPFRIVRPRQVWGGYGGSGGCWGEDQRRRTARQTNRDQMLLALKAVSEWLYRCCR